MVAHQPQAPKIAPTAAGLRRSRGNSALLRDERRALRSVFQNIGSPKLETADELRLTSVEEFLTPDARHHFTSQADFNADPRISNIIKRTYDLFLRFSNINDGTEFDEIATKWRAYWHIHSPGNDRSACIDQIPEVQMDKSRIPEDEGRLTEALALVKMAVAAANDRAHFHFRLGVLSERTDDLDGAVVAMRQAMSLDALDLSRFCAAPRARLSPLPLKTTGLFRPNVECSRRGVLFRHHFSVSVRRDQRVQRRQANAQIISHLSARQPAGQRDTHRIFAKFIWRCPSNRSPLVLQHMLSKERHQTATGPLRFVRQLRKRPVRTKRSQINWPNLAHSRCKNAPFSAFSRVSGISEENALPG